MSKIGFIGVGVMGMPMARNLMENGHRVRAFDLDDDALADIVRSGAEAAGSARHAADGAEFVVTMLPTGDHVAAAVFGSDGAAESLGPDSLLIDMSTGLPAHFDALARRLESKGLRVIDAPVGRTSKDAEEGTLLIMVGGEAEDASRPAPSWNVWATRSSTAGPAAPESAPSWSTTTCRSCPTSRWPRRSASRRAPASTGTSWSRC